MTGVNEMGLPLSRAVVPPRSGWKEHCVYLVDVSFNASNPIHRALLHVGFVDNGKPGSYSEIWCNSYERSHGFGEAYYLCAVRQLTSKEDTKS